MGRKGSKRLFVSQETEKLLNLSKQDLDLSSSSWEHSLNSSLVCPLPLTYQQLDNNDEAVL